MEYNSSRALQLLRVGTQLTNARFREGQEEAIRRIVEHIGPKVGRGKSRLVEVPF